MGTEEMLANLVGLLMDESEWAETAEFAHKCRKHLKKIKSPYYDLVERVAKEREKAESA